MKCRYFTFLFLSFLISSEVEVDGKAPLFKLENEYGEKISLEDFSGKKIILEWTNHECPFVIRHYETQNMQTLQKDFTEDGVIWLSIISSAPNRQGHITKKQSIQLTEDRDAYPTHVLFDPDGSVGKMYGAKTTPHMYIIDEQRLLRYAGAIDDLGMTGALFNTDLSTSNNYIRLAMNSIAENKEIKDKKTRPYGCSIKYP